MDSFIEIFTHLMKINDTFKTNDLIQFSNFIKYMYKCQIRDEKIHKAIVYYIWDIIIVLKKKHEGKKHPFQSQCPVPGTHGHQYGYIEVIRSFSYNQMRNE